MLVAIGGIVRWASRDAALLRDPHPRSALARPHRHAAPRPRRGPHAGLRAPRHQGGGPDARALRGRRARLRDGAGQHVPPLPLARPRPGAAAGRPAPLHALAAAGDHRLGRLPGLLHGPRHGGRRDQGPRDRRARRGDPADRGGGRALPLLRRRLDPLHGPRDLDGGPGRAGLGHRARLRRVHAVPRHARVHGALDRAHAPLARPLPGLARRRTGRPGRPCTASSRAGWRRTCGAGRPQEVASRGTFGLAIGGSLGQDKAQMYEVVGWTTRGAAGGAPAPPARHRRRGRPAARRRARRGHVRLRDAHAHRPPRHGARARPGRPLAGRPRQGPLPRGGRADLPRLPVPRVRGGLLARLPALPHPDRRGDRRRASSRCTTSPSCAC